MIALDTRAFYCWLKSQKLKSKNPGQLKELLSTYAKEETARLTENPKDDLDERATPGDSTN